MNEKVELNTDSRTYVVQKKIKHGSSSTKKILEETIINQMKKRSTSGTDEIRKGSEWVIQYGVTNASVNDILEDEYSIDHKRWLTETYPKENSKIFSHELDFSDSGENSPEPSKPPTPPEKPPPVVPKEKPPERKKVVVIKEPETEESSLEEVSEEEPPTEKPSTNCAEYCKKYLEEKDPDWMAHEMNRTFRRNKPHVCDSSHSCYNNTSNSYILNDHKLHDFLSFNGRCSHPENSHICSSFSYVEPDPSWDERISWTSQHPDNFVDKHCRLNARTNDISALCERCVCDQQEDINDRSRPFQEALRPMESNLFMGQKKTLYFIKSFPYGLDVMEEEKRGKRKDFWRTSACTSLEEAIESHQSTYMSQEEHANSQQPSFRPQEEPVRGQPSTYRPHVENVRGPQSPHGSQEESVRGQQATFRQKEEYISGQTSTYRPQDESVRGQQSLQRLKEESGRGQQATFRQNEEPVTNQPSNYRSNEESARVQQASFRQKEEPVNNQQYNFRPQEESARSKQVTFRPKEKSSRGQQTSYWPTEEFDESIHPACRSHEEVARIQSPSTCTSADHQDYSKLYGLSPKSLEGRSLFWRRSPFDPASGLPCSEPDPSKPDVSSCSYRPRT